MDTQEKRFLGIWLGMWTRPIRAFSFLAERLFRIEKQLQAPLPAKDSCKEA